MSLSTANEIRLLHLKECIHNTVLPSKLKSNKLLGNILSNFCIGK